MKLFKTKKRVHNENWKAWDFYDDKDQYGLITYDVTYLESDAHFQCVNEVSIDLLIPEVYISEGNFPSSEGHFAMIELEDELIKQLQKKKVECMQVIRLTYDGARTFVFEVNELVKFLETVKIWISGIHGFEVNIEKGESWAYYNKWKPTAYNWLQIDNQAIVELLLSHGSNIDLLHKLEFSFGGSSSNLEKLKVKLVNEGGRYLLSEDDLLEVEFESMLDTHEIDPLTFFLSNTAAEYDCIYEGWRSAIVK
ncbi:MAG: ribonuclease E inhibitor RraB [Crocinitomicaceae bacterium]|nr:ribonuclease E inhibitor RraB [Crocinitomicaceae bacterium]